VQHEITPEIAERFERMSAAFEMRHGRKPCFGDGVLKEEIPPVVELPTVEFVVERDIDDKDGDEDE
jgi:hypothetical protein